MTTTIRVAHSPDSDDAFMFYALAEGKLDTGDLTYVHELQDIESLNRRALSAELEVTAVSIHAYAYLADKYALLSSGSSMGDGYGPRLVARRRPRAIRGARCGASGSAFPARSRRRASRCGSTSPTSVQVVMPFDTIEDAVARGRGGRRPAHPRGPAHLRGPGTAPRGRTWARGGCGETGLPLPLGGNVVRRDLGTATINQVARDLRASIEYALAHRRPALDHAKRFNRGIGDERTDTFVGMYVNDWTVDYGARGRAAVQLLLDRAAEAGIIPHRVEVEFVDGNT